jgi:hypothetical protein
MTELVDPSTAKIVDHILIKDAETGAVLVNQRGTPKNEPNSSQPQN